MGSPSFEFGGPYSGMSSELAYLFNAYLLFSKEFHLVRLDRYGSELPLKTIKNQCIYNMSFNITYESPEASYREFHSRQMFVYRFRLCVSSEGLLGLSWGSSVGLKGDQKLSQVDSGDLMKSWKKNVQIMCVLAM